MQSILVDWIPNELVIFRHFESVTSREYGLMMSLKFEAVCRFKYAFEENLIRREVFHCHQCRERDSIIRAGYSAGLG